MDVACDVVHPGLEKLLTWSVGRGPVPAPATAQPAYDTQRGPGLITPRPSSLVASQSSGCPLFPSAASLRLLLTTCPSPPLRGPSLRLPYPSLRLPFRLAAPHLSG